MMQALIEAILAGLSTVPGAKFLTTPTLHLYTAVAVPLNQNMVVGNFTEADFAGYAAVTLPTLVGPVNLPAGDGKGMFADGVFTASSGITTPGQVIVGYWVDNAATDVYLAEQFPAPVLIVNPGDFVDVSVFFGLPYQTQVENG
jgi:hypothetical protein